MKPLEEVYIMPDSFSIKDAARLFMLLESDQVYNFWLSEVLKRDIFF